MYSIDELTKARDRAAEIVTHYGVKYLPIFERMEREVQLKQEQERSLRRAQHIVTQNGTHSGTQMSV